MAEIRGDIHGLGKYAGGSVRQMEGIGMYNFTDVLQKRWSIPHISQRSSRKA